MSEFIDAETYTGGKDDNLNFRIIVLAHLKRITGLASKEFRGGYWQERVRWVGGAGINERFYVPDSREEYINAICNLSDLLLPLFDEEMEKGEESIETEADEKYDKIKSDGKKQDWLNVKVRIYRKLFRYLSKFLNRINYLDVAVIEE